MPDLTSAILALDAATATRILSTIAEHRLSPIPGVPTHIDPELAQALASEVGVTPSNTVSEGELARQSLLLLAEDPERLAELQYLVENPPAAAFDPVTFLAVGAAALLLLQSHIKIQRDPKKGWSFKFEKKPANDSVLKVFIEKVLGFSRSK